MQSHQNLEKSKTNMVSVKIIRSTIIQIASNNVQNIHSFNHFIHAIRFYKRLIIFYVVLITTMTFH